MDKASQARLSGVVAKETEESCRDQAEDSFKVTPLMIRVGAERVRHLIDAEVAADYFAEEVWAAMDRARRLTRT